MANTVPDSIYYPQGTDSVAPLQTILSTMAASVQTALSKRQGYDWKWQNASARAAQTGMRAGDRGYQTDTGVDYVYNGTAWTSTLLPTYGAITPAGIYSIDSARGGRAVAQGGRVYLEGAIRSSTAQFNTGEVYTAGSLPAAFAPKVAKAFAPDINRTHGYLVVNTTGAITFVVSQSFSGVLDMSLDGFNWTDIKYA